MNSISMSIAPARLAAIPGYDDQIIRRFTVATTVWALFGFSAGVIVAAQLAFPLLNLGEYFTFGRLRPVHTSGVILASSQGMGLLGFRDRLVWTRLRGEQAWLSRWAGGVVP
ncbi:hypothetical protein SAMN05892877_11425 [Rhizobium subbaraonis]|uniref:Uncharacterized protein n=1 Tax=Rhizobium subbaraonis TaxID=908946 RepID=A0A285UY06_9HYPH|nr:hypothetical protein SAMN05892877_11425 [Rhizobium subbaraonis]